MSGSSVALANISTPVTFFSLVVPPGAAETIIYSPGSPPASNGTLTANFPLTLSPITVSWNSVQRIIYMISPSLTSTIPLPPISTPASATPQVTSTEISFSTSATPNTTPPLTSTHPTAASASTQSNSPSSTLAPHKPDSNGISKGAAAGIGVGCLLAGALMAALIFFLCTARARKRQRNRDREAGTVPFLKGAIPLGTKEQNLESSPNSYNLESSLAQPLEDKAISGDISKINNSVKNHVQSYYHGSKLSPGLLDHDDLQALGSDLPMSPGTLSTLLANPDTREIALRFSIAWVLVSRIRLDSHPRITFLPPEIAQCVQSMGIDIGGARGTRAMFFSKWKAISAELLQNSYGENPISPGDPRNHNISSALDALDGVLRPFADSRMDNNQRRRNLEEILKRAASFAFVLFSQPSSWVFDWQDQDAIKSGSLCIFPSLVQVTDDAGEVLKQPRPFSEAIIRQLDS